MADAEVAVVDVREENETGKTDKKKKEPVEKEPTASLSELYQYASGLELFGILIAFICAAGSGVCQPMMLLAFQSMFNNLGSAEVSAGLTLSMDVMMETFLIMIYVGGGMFAGRWISVTLIEYITASQMQKYKREYLRAILRQDVAWYDTSNPEELSTVFAEAMVKVQKGLKAIC